MPRRSDPHRWLSIGIRTLHLASVVGVFSAPSPDAWAALLLGSGALLIADDLWRFGLDWLRWVQAWVILGKLGVFGVCALAGHPVVGLWAALVLGSLISHAPGALRHAPLLGAPGPCAGHACASPKATP